MTDLLAAIAFLDMHSGTISAVAAVAVAAFTWRLIVVGRDQHTAAIKAIDLGRDEFNATHRPRLVLRELTLQRPGVQGPAFVTFNIANSGDSSAILVDSSFVVDRYELGIKRPSFNISGIAAPLSGLTLGPGEYRAETQISDVGFYDFKRADESAKWHSGSLAPRPTPELQIVFDGFVVYKDARAIKRRSRFYRVYDFKNEQFVAGSDPEREYAD